MDVKGKLPKKIIRLDDGMEFVLNESTERYLIRTGISHLDYPAHFHHEHAYDRLMNDPRCKGMFKVADGTEDIAAMKKSWIDRMNAIRKGFGGCGDGDDEGYE